MSNEFSIVKASRQSVKPMIALYAESGCGKTLSSLFLARGLAGPSGKLVLVDSESKRGSLYADVLPGGYETLDLAAPFSPKRYIGAMEAVEQSGATVGIIDSGSHEWEGEKGVLDSAMENEAKSGKAGLHNWKTPKLEHNRWILKLLQSPIPWIVCLRAKYKSRQTKENGKTVIIKDDHTSPIQAEDFIFEATAHAEILSDHSIHLTKCSHPDLRKCFPEKGPITIQHGELIAKWCASPSGPVGNPSGDPRKALMREIWECSKAVRGDGKTWQSFEQWGLSKTILGDTETVTSMTEERLRELLEALKKVL